MWLRSIDTFQPVFGTGETHIQILQTVPAEGVFAALCTALVPLDVDTTHRALLDGHVRVAVEEHRHAVNWSMVGYEATKGSG